MSGDSDGFLNLFEFIADTVPTNANSYHRIILLTNRTPRYVTFPSSTGRVYDLHYNTNLIVGPWLPLTTNVPGLLGTTSIPDTNDTPNRSYRVRVKLP